MKRKNQEGRELQTKGWTILGRLKETAGGRQRTLCGSGWLSRRQRRETEGQSGQTVAMWTMGRCAIPLHCAMPCNSSLPSLQNTLVKALENLKGLSNLFGFLLILAEAERPRSIQVSAHVRCQG